MDHIKLSQPYCLDVLRNDLHKFLIITGRDSFLDQLMLIRQSRRLGLFLLIFRMRFLGATYWLSSLSIDNRLRQLHQHLGLGIQPELPDLIERDLEHLPNGLVGHLEHKGALGYLQRQLILLHKLLSLPS
jgi:hypothetical protein